MQEGPHDHSAVTHHWKPGRGQLPGTDWWECLPPSECTEPDGDVTKFFGNEVRADYYLPMDCPNCGRHRLLVIHTILPDGKPHVVICCDKCRAMSWDCDPVQHGSGGRHEQRADGWVQE